MSTRITPKRPKPKRANSRGQRLWRRWRAPIVLAAVLIAAVAVIAALRGGDNPAAPAGSGTSITLESSGGSRVGDAAPVFRAATTTTGGQFTLPAGKPAVLLFMAGWCASCVPEAEALDRIERDFGDRIAVLAVDVDPADSPDTLRRFTEAVGARYGFTHDVDGTLTGAFTVASLDTTVVIDATGRIVYRDGGPTNEATLRTALAEAGLS